MFSAIYKKFDVFLLYSSSFFNPFIIIPKTSFLLNFKLGGSVFYIEKLFNMLIAIQISFLNINVMTLISLFFVEIQNVCCFILVDIKMVFGKSSNWWQGYELNEITFLLFKYAIHFHTQKINTLHLFYIPSKNFASLFILQALSSNVTVHVLQCHLFFGSILCAFNIAYTMCVLYL